MEKVRSFWDRIDTRDDTALPDVKVDPDDDFCVMYTSGSLGTQRSRAYPSQRSLCDTVVA